jgi:hypothetical protein
LSRIIAAARSLSAWKGGFPVSSSYRTTPMEYRSDLPSTSDPRTCSGERYLTVPRAFPVVERSVPAKAALAMPKSVT